MNASIRSFIICLFALGYGVADLAAATENEMRTSSTSKYPCDVFNYNFCFRKPYGTFSELGSGPDFDIYRISDADSRQLLWSIYVGTTPERMREIANIFDARSSGIKVSIGMYADTASAGGLDLMLAYPNGVFVHIFGVESEQGKRALIEMLPSFRLCKKKGMTSIACKTSPILDVKTQKALRDAIEKE
ncbi:hypothetical protein GCM10027084_19950 [Pseudoxanthomonas sangjuensis]|uniref:hypothetical protein n=1 Tax=Pseudoxanthomonas sangjuensis TaxID=1503750 RepID=UPI0013920CD7|nr:hypothetical protein [Pseudoxanthomonas sangjuensis]